MGCGSQGIVEKGKRIHPPVGSIERGTAQIALGEGPEELRLRWTPGQGNAGGVVRWTQPTGYLSLHVRTGLAGGLPKLLVCIRPSRRRAPAPGRPRCHAGGSLKGAAGQNRGVQEAHGLAFSVGVVPW